MEYKNLQEEYQKISENGCRPPKGLKNFRKENIFKPNYYCLMCKNGNVNKICSCKIDRWCVLSSGVRFVVETKKEEEEQKNED